MQSSDCARNLQIGTIFRLRKFLDCVEHIYMYVYMYIYILSSQKLCWCLDLCFLFVASIFSILNLSRFFLFFFPAVPHGCEFPSM